MIYYRKSKLDAGACGADSKMSVLGALTLTEDSVTGLTGELKIDGVSTIKNYNALMIFTRNRMKFLKPLDWNEDITVESFISSKSFVRFYIDTCIKNSVGDIAMYSRIELCALDLENGRLRKLDSIGIDSSFETEKPLIDMDYFPKRRDELEFVEQVKVRASSIDYAHHTNNIEYARFVINTHTYEELLAHPVKELELCYVSQSYEGDMLDIYRRKTDENALFEIQKDNAPVFRCEMYYE